MMRSFRSMIRSINSILLCALALSVGAPAQAMMKQQLQGAGENLTRAASTARSAVVGGVRYSADWVNRKIESSTTQFPLWARRRVAGVFRRFATPNAQELQVMKKWMNHQPLSAQEQTIWKKYKGRVYSSRGAIAAIATVIIAILAAIAGTAVVVSNKRAREREAARIAAIPAPPRETYDAWHVRRQEQKAKFPFPPGTPVLFNEKPLLFNEKPWVVQAVQIDGSLDLKATDNGQLMRAINPAQVQRDKRLEEAPLPPAAVPTPVGFDPLGVTQTAVPGKPVDVYEGRAAEREAQEQAVRAEARRVALIEESQRRAEASAQERMARLRSQAEQEERQRMEAPVKRQREAGAGGIVVTRVPEEQSAARFAAEQEALVPQSSLVESYEDPELKAANLLAQAFLSASQLESAEQARDEQVRKDFIEESMRIQIQAHISRLRDEWVAIQREAKSRATQRRLEMKGREIAQLARLQEVAFQLLDDGVSISAQVILERAIGIVRSEEQEQRRAEEQAARDRVLFGPKVSGRAQKAIKFGVEAREMLQARRAALVAQWANLKAAIEEYMRQVRANIIQGTVTQFARLDELRDLVKSPEFAALERGTKDQILRGINEFVGAGREQGSLQEATHKVLMLGAPPTGAELEARIVANLEKVPDDFRLTPQNIYSFLGLSDDAGKRTSFSKMEGIIRDKLVALQPEGHSAKDLGWLGRQLKYMLTRESEKTALDAFLGDEAALRRLQPVDIADATKDAQVQNFVAVQELLQDAQGVLR